jgi:Tfp pilus assembly protein PilN
VSLVNLLPPELRERQAVRRTTSLVVVAGLAALALIGILYLFQILRLSQVRTDLEAQQSTNARLVRQIASLREFAALQAEHAAKEALIDVILVNEVSWSSALLDVSRMIPEASYLTNLTGQIEAPVAGEVVAVPTGGTPETTLVGNMTFAGVANQTETITTWITRLEEVQGWVNAWVNSAEEDAPGSRIYTFSNGLDLTQEAVTERGQGVVAP